MSAARINQFLHENEVLPQSIRHPNLNTNVDGKQLAIEMRNMSFCRSASEAATLNSASHLGAEGPDNLCLSDISLSIPKGELVGVMGNMGSGKTTLIEAIAGEHFQVVKNQDTKGYIAINDRVIHVPNNPWLRSGTIRYDYCFFLCVVSVPSFILCI